MAIDDLVTELFMNCGISAAALSPSSGEKARARQRYDKATAWTDKNQPWNYELRRFRTEAAALLGPLTRPPS